MQCELFYTSDRRRETHNQWRRRERQSRCWVVLATRYMPGCMSDKCRDMYLTSSPQQRRMPTTTNDQCIVRPPALAGSCRSVRHVVISHRSLPFQVHQHTRRVRAIVASAQSSSVDSEQANDGAWTGTGRSQGAGPLRPTALNLQQAPLAARRGSRSRAPAPAVFSDLTLAANSEQRFDDGAPEEQDGTQHPSVIAGPQDCVALW